MVVFIYTEMKTDDVILDCATDKCGKTCMLAVCCDTQLILQFCKSSFFEQTIIFHVKILHRTQVSKQQQQQKSAKDVFKEVFSITNIRGSSIRMS